MKAEDLVLSMMERAAIRHRHRRRRLSPAAYTRAPLSVFLAAIAAPTCEALVRDASQRGERPTPLNVVGLTAIDPDACRLH